MQTKAKKDPRVDEYIKEAAPFAKPILNHLRKLVRENFPQAEETIKWGSPFYTYEDKIICGMGTFKAHCKFWVKNWSAIAGDKGDKAKAAMEQMLHIYTVADLPSSSMIKSLLKQAMKFNKPGAKPVKKQTPRKKKPPVKTPSDLMLALRMNPKALVSYEAMSPSNQRHYVEWITQAKTEETHDKRLEKAVESIAAGKTRHWK